MHLYAIGGNQIVSRLAGVKVDRNLIIIYSICGLTAGIGGVLLASRLGAGAPQAGQLYELDAIAAVVVGGSSLKGGIGSLGGTIVGVLLIGILNNMLALLNVSTDIQMISKGIIILGAVIIDTKLNVKNITWKTIFILKLFQLLIKNKAKTLKEFTNPKITSIYILAFYMEEIWSRER